MTTTKRWDDSSTYQLPFELTVVVDALQFWAVVGELQEQIV
jgi:hypothetical protein